MLSVSVFIGLPLILGVTMGYVISWLVLDRARVVCHSRGVGALTPQSQSG